MVGIKVVSTGHAVPDKVVTNDDLSRVVDTNDEWIYSKTGIKERHFCENETNWELALKAADIAIERAGIDKSEIGMLIVATFTPDYATPSIACVLHEKMGLRTDIPSFDLNAACAGYVYGLKVAASLLQSSKERYALVIGSEQILSLIHISEPTRP